MKRPFIITEDDKHPSKPGVLLRGYDRLSISGQQLVRRITLFVAALSVMGWTIAWKLSEPQKKSFNISISKPLKSMQDDEIINLFWEYWIDIYDDKNRIFFNLKGGGVGMRISEKFWENIALDDFLNDSAFRLLFREEILGEKKSQEFVPPKAIPVPDDAIPVATPVLEDKWDDVPRAIPVRALPIGIPVAIPVR